MSARLRRALAPLQGHGESAVQNNMNLLDSAEGQTFSARLLAFSEAVASGRSVRTTYVEQAPG
jgi:hypothetical protein